MLFTHQRKPYHIIFISRRVTLHIVGLTPSPSNTRGRTRTDTVSILSRLSLPLDYTGITLHLSVCYVGITPSILTVCNGAKRK